MACKVARRSLCGIAQKKRLSAQFLRRMTSCRPFFQQQFRIVGQLRFPQSGNAQIFLPIQIGVVHGKVCREFPCHCRIRPMIAGVRLFNVHAEHIAANGFPDGERRQPAVYPQHAAFQFQCGKVLEKGVNGVLLRHAGSIGIAVLGVIAFRCKGNALGKVVRCHLRENRSIPGKLGNMISLFVILFSGECHKVGGAIEIVRTVAVVFQRELFRKYRLQQRQALLRQAGNHQRLLHCRRICRHCRDHLFQVARSAGERKMRRAVRRIECTDQIEPLKGTDAGIRPAAPCQIVGEAVFAPHEIRLPQSRLDPRSFSRRKYLRCHESSNNYNLLIWNRR